MPATNIKSIDANKPLLNGDEQAKSNADDAAVQRNFNKECRIIAKSEGIKPTIGGVRITNGTNKVMHSEEEWDEVPPDGGWGWLILFGSMLVNILVPGTVKSFGVLFVEFLEVFEASPAAAAWIPALCYFLYSSLGPVSSILSVKYSYRIVTLLGGTFAAVGMILSYFAQSVTYLYISYGFLVGTGAGLAFPPTVYIVTSYFVRLRGLANGLCISGSAIGSIILPPVLRILLEEYGYRGAVLIMGGITLNVWIGALFYDPVEKHMKKVRRKQTVEEKEELLQNDEQIPKSTFITSTEENHLSTPRLDQRVNNESFTDTTDLGNNSFIRSASSVAVPNYRGAVSPISHRERKISVPTTKEMSRTRTYVFSRGQMNSTPALHSVPETNKALDFFSQSRLPTSKRPKSTPRRSPSTSSFQYVSTPYHGSTLTLQPEQFTSSLTLKSLRSFIAKPDAKVEDVSTSNKLFDVSLLKDPLYLVILISNSTNAISYTNFIILLPSYAIMLGYDKTMSAYLISIVSALDLVGRIGGSALSDVLPIPKQWYFIGGLLLSGISLACLPFSKTYLMLSVCCSVFGLASGIYVGITAVIMADMLGTERLQSTYGISLFVNGVLQLIGPPLCGVWFEAVRDYGPLFFTLGIVLICGASIWGFVPFIKKNNSKTQETDDHIQVVDEIAT